MRRLRRRPPAIRSILLCISFSPAGNRDAAKLDSGCCRSKGDVIGIVSRQTSIAHGTDQAEPTKDLHCPGADVVALHAGWLAGGARLGEQYADAAFGEVHSQAEAHRAATHH